MNKSLKWLRRDRWRRTEAARLKMVSEGGGLPEWLRLAWDYEKRYGGSTAYHPNTPVRRP